MKNFKSLATIIAIISILGITSAHATSLIDLAQMSPIQKKQEQQYFGAHSFQFPSIFKRYHPGPYWILKNNSAFHLTIMQTLREKKLKYEMAMSTITDNHALQRAYANYAKDSSAAQPSLVAIKDDISQIGKAETQLAWEMIPYHLQGYALLDPTQKSTYTQLAAETWAQQHKAHDIAN